MNENETYYAICTECVTPHPLADFDEMMAHMNMSEETIERFKAFGIGKKHE